MIDDTPYIIVDNHKIAPISRASKSDSATAGEPNRADQPFGIVDRVTLSREAMEKFRQHQTSAEVDPPAAQSPSGKQPTSLIPLLTHPPPKRR